MHGNDLVKKLEPEISRNVQRACIYLMTEVRKLISTPSRTVTIAKTKSGKEKRVLGPRGSNRSKPGEPPHKDYGRLRASVAHQMVEPTRGLVGSALKYARFLELGTSKMAARPFLRRSLRDHAQVIERIVRGGSP